MLANGAKVAAFARTVTPELQQLMDANPERVYVGSVDITDSKAVTSFIKDAAKVLGPIDALVNNAAIGQDSLHLHTTPERIEDIIHHLDNSEELLPTGERLSSRRFRTIGIELGRGSCSETIWTTDLSHEYVKINAEYRT